MEFINASTVNIESTSDILIAKLNEKIKQGKFSVNTTDDGFTNLSHREFQIARQKAFNAG